MQAWPGDQLGRVTYMQPYNGGGEGLVSPLGLRSASSLQDGVIKGLNR